MRKVVESDTAYYRHCGDSTVLVRVEYSWIVGGGDHHFCAGPWTVSVLGHEAHVDYAVAIATC
ncbi:hypothetical protein IU433_02300 [Nocardia puris]|nr:DUF6355 family natural product biosynthesis protein [Nocardia puris]MBF6210617.1 hypothetical protein [Nocardia puris]MBF6369343.1 hypothetical protein [Nocardia puris]MBF6457878.1 hypothetical protein [Nocardia puris]